MTLSKHLTLGISLCAFALPASAQNGTYTSGSDFMAWPLGTPAGMNKLVGANLTDDDIDDAVARHGAALYFVHSPAMFPRWNPVAEEITDFAVVKGRGEADGVVFSDVTGLKYAYWEPDSGTPAVLTLTGSDWSRAARLCALTDEAGSTVIVGQVNQRVLIGRLGSNGVWQGGAHFSEQTTSIAVLEFTPHATGFEIATISAGVLRLRGEDGAPLQLPPLPATVAHSICRLPGGGVNGLDSLLYIAASAQTSWSFQTVQEVYLQGASTPFETGPWIIGKAVAAQPWAPSIAGGVILQASNTNDIFRFADIGSVPNQLTLVPWASPAGQENYFHIAVKAEQPSEPTMPPVTDGIVACADFDADGFDDVFVASPFYAHSYYYPALDDPFRYNAIHTIDFSSKVLGSSGRRRDGGSGATDTTVVQLGIEAVVNSLPHGFTAPANGLEVVAWTREGGLASYVNPVPADAKVVPANPSPSPTTVVLTISTNALPEDTLCYVSLRAVNATFGAGGQVTINQRGSLVNCVTVLDQTPLVDPLLCALFDTEPDRYSPENRQQNNCGQLPGDGPVILGGYNRRSNIGPYQSGQGSPGGN